MVPVGDIRGLDLTAEEGFLLSRIDGHVNVGSLLSMLGWDREKTMRLLESLLRKHLLNFDRREIALQVFGPGDVVAPPKNQGEEASASPGYSIELTQVNETGPAINIDPDTVEKVPDMDQAKCIEILTWAKKVEYSENYYQMFEIPLGADPKSVKRQYRQMAMTYHPDKFFRKEIGGYRPMIETSWKRVQEAYEFLSDPEKKKTYDEEVMARARAKPKTDPPPAAAPAPAPQAGKPASPPPASPSKPSFTPPPPPPSKAPSGVSTATPDIPPWEAKSSPAAAPEPARAKVMSSMERKIKAEIEARMAKARAQFDQAKIAFAEGKFSAANGSVKLAMEFDPRNEEFKAWYESNKKKIETGIMEGILRKAELAEAGGDIKRALEEYEKGLAIFPDNPTVNLAAGKILAWRGDNPKKARDYLSKGLPSSPSDLVGLLGMCRVLRETGSVKNAQRYIDRAKDLAPKDPRVLEEIKEIKKASK